MKKITEISLCNYRAFLNKPGEESKYKISLPKGENLLIYGENGSGKSSLFKGLKDVFYSANNPGITIIGNIFAGKGDPGTEIKVRIDEKVANGSWTNIDDLQFNDGAPNTDKNTTLLNSTNAYLTYRDVLKTYLYTNQNENPNLFDFFIIDLLGRVTDGASNTAIKEEIEKLEHKIEDLRQAILDICALPDDENPLLTKGDTIGVTAISLEELENLETAVTPLNNQIRDILIDLFSTVNVYLKDYFNSNISVEIKEPDKIIYSHGHNLDFSLRKELFLKVYYFEKEIDVHAYPTFLNEARLSAIAICLYLASVKKDKPANNNLKFLFLDDIFIGVDTSNRIPLLKILADDFKDFQIFLSTYDREWFELARRWMNQTDLKFRHIELYEGIDDSVNPPTPFPILIDPSMNYEEKALYYYKKKDYPAAANYLRKACESKLKDILPRHMQLKENDGEIVEIELLGELYTKFKEYCRINSFYVPALNQFETYTKIIFNSLSHDDLSANHYKSEIEEALKIIGEFDKFKIKKILEPKLLRTALFDKVNTSGIKHNYDIDLKENLYWIQYDVQPAKFSVSSCQLRGASFSDKHPLQVALVRILNEHGYDPQTDYITLCHSIQATHGKKLDELMTFE